jgi:hypothetical protein
MSDADSEDENDDDEKEDEEITDEDPIVESKVFLHDGEVNRIRVCVFMFLLFLFLIACPCSFSQCMPQQSHYCSTWSSTGKVHIWNIKEFVAALDKPPLVAPKSPTPTFTNSKHTQEGFAMDWSPVVAGRMVTGGCDKNIYLWEPKESTWVVENTPFTGHSGSVEDLQWSPTEPTVCRFFLLSLFSISSFASPFRFSPLLLSTRPSVSGIQGRLATSPSCLSLATNLMLTSFHGTRMSCFPRSLVSLIQFLVSKTPAFLASGSDDATVKVWDFRKFRSYVSICVRLHFSISHLLRLVMPLGLISNTTLLPLLLLNGILTVCVSSSRSPV